ncbi:dihydrolipoyl dehydrogenase [Bacillus suaedaesalsae]|uniref:Dihydrolipoyl dehydrogenase n=1 Tax=Bacillus suaedaesalsae TaxID=2810349 RepID=A0ABS2DN14_9BACI|nr:dihydrolipoyl dehydrogenase [Bacillus suaedaesalsae]MBM6619425.1 dihydrolipoyl dehydrogenase [Bacillus suaedaesalsae]
MVVGELAQERNVVIIGGGPGGYHAAIRAAQLGLSVTLVEKLNLGGVCLNEGCIPSKVFTTSAKKYSDLSNFHDFGIELEDFKLNLMQLHQYKNKVVAQLRSGVEALCKANKVDVVNGTAYFISEEKIGVESGHQFDVYKFKNAIIAAGASLHKSAVTDSELILDERTIYSLEKIPDHLIVYGSDYISIEVAMVFQQLGAKVSICLQEEDFKLDTSINRELTRMLKKAKIKIYKGSKLRSVRGDNEVAQVTIEMKNGEVTLEGSHCFVSREKKPNIEGLGIDRLPIQCDQDGFIMTNSKCQTSVPHILAIGDVTTTHKLAVIAIKQGKVAAEVIAGMNSEYDDIHIPTVIHANPPIATVGLTEEQAKFEYKEIKVSQAPIQSNGFASVIGNKDGFIKTISDAESGIIVGVHMMGHGAIELLSTSIIGLEMVAREEDFSFPYYAHPSINESLLESVEGLNGKAIHLPPKSKQLV